MKGESMNSSDYLLEKRLRELDPDLHRRRLVALTYARDMDYVRANEESHVHYHVDGYKSLAWAVPIEATNVQTKEIKDGEMHTNFVNAIMEFAQMVNIETVTMINRLLI